MTTDSVRALELWLSAQPISDELNEIVVPVSIISGRPTTTPLSTKELRYDRYL